MAAAAGPVGRLPACSSPWPRPTSGSWPNSPHRVAPDDAPLARMRALQGVPAGHSGFRPLLLSSVALDTRLALIEQARTGLGLQTYLLGNDSTGHEILCTLRDAVGRGVRVRLLIDDL